MRSSPAGAAQEITMPSAARSPSRETGAFTLIELLVVTAICDVASANYVGVFGIAEPGVDGEGVFSRNNAIRIGDITDGTSQTLLVGERSFHWAPATWVGAVTSASMVPAPGSPAPPGF